MITIDTNAPEIAKQIDRIARDQLPFATSLALTNIAAAGMREARKELETTLTLRNKFSASGIQTERAEKNDWPTQTSKVGIEERRSYLVDQVLGATRKPLKSPFKGVPQTAVIPRSASGRMPASRRPKALIANLGKKRGKFYLIKQAGRELLFRGTQGERGELAYVFTKQAKIKPRFRFMEAVERGVAASYEAEFEKAIERALRTQR